MIQACIFDMDGVLIDTEPVWRRVEHDVFARVGLELSDEQLRQTWGMRIGEVVDHWYTVRPWTGVRPRAIVREILREMVLHVRQDGVVLPGAVEAIDTARSVGLRVGLASSSSRELIDAVLQRLGVGDRVDCVCTADDEMLGKPDPAVYLSAARAMGIPPGDCVALEDSPAGIVSAKAAGMYCVAVRTPAIDIVALANADMVIDSLLEFTPELLQRIREDDVRLTGKRTQRPR